MPLIKVEDHYSTKIKNKSGFIRMFLDMKTYNLNNTALMKDFFNQDSVVFGIWTKLKTMIKEMVWPITNTEIEKVI